MHGLVLGRFQPLHNGHVALIKRAMEDCQQVTVGIGSTNTPRRSTDPFTLEERQAMLEAVFPGVTVAPIPDLHDPMRYVGHVLKLVPADCVYGNSSSMELFEDDGVPVKRPGLEERANWQGAAIREQLAEDDVAWRKAVPKAVAALLDEWDATARLRSLA